MQSTVTAAINIRAGLFVDDDGSLYPITNWLDAEGDECDRNEAVTAVAGEAGCWFALTLSDFVSAPQQ